MTIMATNTRRRFITIDLETYLIGRRLTPRIVSVAEKFTGASYGYAPTLVNRIPNTRRVDKQTIKGFVDAYIQEAICSNSVFVGHNIAFDFACLCVEFPEFIPAVFKLYNEGRVHDTMIREKLIGIRFGESERRSVKLASCVNRYFNINMIGKEGEDIWRLNYSKLDGVPIDEWPEDARKYALDDVSWTWKVLEAQEKAYGDAGTFKDEAAQCRNAWALHLISVYGMRVNQERAEDWLEAVEAEAIEGKKTAQRLGILRDNGTKNMLRLRELVEEAYQGKPPLTEKGAVSTAGDVLRESNDEALTAYADSKFNETLLTRYAPIFREGRTVHPSYKVLMKTGRTSCSKPNMQNPPRSGGFRECFEPRPGCVFVLCDYDQIELLALAQCHIWLFGPSSIADAVNAGRDLHMDVAAKLNPEDPKAFRQFAKVANYGFPGGLSANSFRSYAKGYAGLEVTEEEAHAIRNAWLETWPEMKRYFDWIGNQTRWGQADAEQFVSGRIRGACSFSQYANTLFQGLTADGALTALSRVQTACFVDESSPLFGARAVAFLHDEIILEAEEEKAAECAEELARIMVDTMREFIPDVQVNATPYLSRMWSKKADRVVDSAGGLIPWEP